MHLRPDWCPVDESLTWFTPPGTLMSIASDASLPLPPLDVWCHVIGYPVLCCLMFWWGGGQSHRAYCVVRVIFFVLACGRGPQCWCCYVFSSPYWLRGMVWTDGKPGEELGHCSTEGAPVLWGLWLCMVPMVLSCDIRGEVQCLVEVAIYLMPVGGTFNNFPPDVLDVLADGSHHLCTWCGTRW